MAKTVKPVRQLHFCALKIPESVKVGLMQTIKSFASLRRLKISGINLSATKAFAPLLECVLDA